MTGNQIVLAAGSTLPDEELANIAEPIRRRWQAAATAIVETGRMLIEARANLAHGDFEAMVEGSLPFQPRTARKLMAIAQHEWLANRTHESVLPPAWTTLYEMSRLPSEALERALSEGMISAEMDRADVKLLTRPAAPTPSAVPPIQATGRNYRAILADPSWPHATWSDRGQIKAPSMHYPPMTEAEIMALPVADLADENAVLVLWGRWPDLPLAQRAIEAWGFRYATGGGWFKTSRTGEKQAFGTGHILRNACDPFLVATIGRPVTDGSRLRNAIDGAAVDGAIREHSRKPDSIYDLVEALVPGGPYVELFARQRRPGWDTWGTETDKYEYTGGR